MDDGSFLGGLEMQLSKWPWMVAQDHLADVGWSAYETLWLPLIEKQKASRKPIPSFGEFLFSCHERRPVRRWLAGRGFVFSRPEFKEVIRPVEGNLRTLYAARPLLVPRP